MLLKDALVSYVGQNLINLPIDYNWSFREELVPFSIKPTGYNCYVARAEILAKQYR